MPADWPTSLPNMKLGTSVGDEESRLISPMDSGPASVRKRFTAFTQKVDVPMVLTGAQLAIFQTFYRTTINQGTDSFNWKDPATDAAAILRFKSPPVWSSVKSGEPNDRIWKGTLSLEILP